MRTGILISYCVSKKWLPILCSKLLHKMGHNFFDRQYANERLSIQKMPLTLSHTVCINMCVYKNSRDISKLQTSNSGPATDTINGYYCCTEYD